MTYEGCGTAVSMIHALSRTTQACVISLNMLAGPCVCLCVLCVVVLFVCCCFVDVVCCWLVLACVCCVPSVVMCCCQ